jgi:hypothetical protein
MMVKEDPPPPPNGLADLLSIFQSYQFLAHTGQLNFPHQALHAVEALLRHMQALNLRSR